MHSKELELRKDTTLGDRRLFSFLIGYSLEGFHGANGQRDFKNSFYFPCLTPALLCPIISVFLADLVFAHFFAHLQNQYYWRKTVGSLKSSPFRPFKGHFWPLLVSLSQ